MSECSLCGAKDAVCKDGVESVWIGWLAIIRDDPALRGGWVTQICKRLANEEERDCDEEAKA